MLDRLLDASNPSPPGQCQKLLQQSLPQVNTAKDMLDEDAKPLLTKVARDNSQLAEHYDYLI